MRSFAVSRVVTTPDRRKLLRSAFPGFDTQKKDVWDGVGIVLIFFLLYAGLVLCIGKPFHPAGGAWAVMLIWLLSSAGGWLVELIGMPAPLGMILTGMALTNINGGHIIKGLPSTWSKEIRAIALSIIFLRSGLEIELKIFKRVGWAATRLLLVPGICEAFFDGGLAIKIFGMPPTFAFALGFILKAVGPALVIQCMFEVQQKRLGTAKAIPATVVAAASFDDMIAITGYTIFIDIAVRPPSGNHVWQIMHGPVSVVLGILGGLLAAFLCSFTKLWNNNVKRCCVVVFAALFMKFIFDKYAFTSGGALGSITLGLFVKELWHRGQPAMFAVPDANKQYTRSVEKFVKWLWRFIVMPLLFGLIGASMRFSTLQHNSIGKACGIIFAGLAVRMPISFLVMYGAGFNWQERLFVAFAWSPKATVQAALALLPRDQVTAAYRSNPRSAEALRYSAYAQEALTTAVFCILICGSIGTLLIRIFAPILLQREPEEGKETMETPIVPGLRPPSPRPMVHDPLDRAENEPRITSAELARQQHGAQYQERDFIAANGGVLGEFMDRIDRVADLVDKQCLGSGNDTDCAQTLRIAVQDLKQRLAEHDQVKNYEVEGANDFLRASQQEHESLRRRPSRSQLPTSVPGSSSSNV